MRSEKAILVVVAVTLLVAPASASARSAPGTSPSPCAGYTMLLRPDGPGNMRHNIPWLARTIGFKVQARWNGPRLFGFFAVLTRGQARQVLALHDLADNRSLAYQAVGKGGQIVVELNSPLAEAGAQAQRLALRYGFHVDHSFSLLPDFFAASLTTRKLSELSVDASVSGIGSFTTLAGDYRVRVGSAAPYTEMRMSISEMERLEEEASATQVTVVPDDRLYVDDPRVYPNLPPQMPIICR